MNILPSYLSCIPRKRELLATDIYFREAWEDFAQQWPDEEALRTLTWRLAPVILKPEAILASNARRGVDLLRGLPFRPVFVRPIRYTRHMVRAAWQYQINKATPERVAAMDGVLQAAEAIYVLLVADDGNPAAPAIVEICERKGAADPSQRKPHDLRRAIGGVQDNLVNFIHSVDEPADVIREIGVLFPSVERAQVIRSISASHSVLAELHDLVADVVQRNPKTNFDLHGILAAIGSAIDAQAIAPRDKAAMVGAVDRLQAGERGGWPRLRELLIEYQIPLDPLDDMVVAALTTVMHRDGEKAIFATEDSKGWHSPLSSPETSKKEKVS